MASARITGTNENIQTYGNGTRDFTSLATWEASTDLDLVTAMQSEVLEGYADSALWDDGILISGATTNASYFRIIRPAAGQKHDGTSLTGLRFEQSGGAGTTAVFGILEAFTSVQDIVGFQNGDRGFAISTFQNATGAGSFIGCIAGPSENVGAGTENGFISTVTGTVFINCLAEEQENSGFFIAAGVSYLYNCVAVNNGTYGFEQGGSPSILKNCLGYNNPTADFESGADAASVTNASGDTTAPGTGSRISQTFVFVDELNNDFHLDVTDTGALNHGTDLSADGVFAFDDDIDGDLFTLWDIGFDENGLLPVSNVELDQASCTADLRVYRWDNVTESTLVEAVRVNGADVLSVEVEGDFGAGGSIGMSGANSTSAGFYPLQTLDTFSASGIAPINETALLLKPTILAGTGVDVNFYLLVRGGLA